MTTMASRADDTVTLSAVPPEAVPSAPETRRRTSTLRTTDVLAAVGAVAASVSVTGLLFTSLTPFTGTLGFVVVAWMLFLGFYALLVSFDEDAPAIRDRISSAVTHSIAFVMLLALVVVVSFVFWRGRSALTHAQFFTDDLSKTGPLDGLDKGGIRHAIVGTLFQITIGLVLAVPVGITAALFLNQLPGRFARLVRTVSEAMTALPSIVAGLFIYATWILALGRPKSGLAAGLALSVMMLPIIVRATDVVLRLVPGTLFEAAYALGAPQWRTVLFVVLPTARSGMATAVILGTARGIGETSPVLLTAGYTTRTNTNALENPMTSLPLAAFNLVKSPSPEMIARGFGAGATLLTIVLVLFVAARIAGGRGAGQLSGRQRRKKNSASARDLDRFERRASTRPRPDISDTEWSALP